MTGTAPAGPAGRAAVVTGIGVTAPTGIGVEAHWAATLAGESGIGPIERFDASGYPVRHAGQVPGFHAPDVVPSRLISQTDHWTHLALHAGELALRDADVDPAGLPEYEMAVVTSSSSGGTEFGQKEMTALYQNDPSHVGAYQSIAWFYAATTGQLSIRHKMRGPCGVLVCEQAGGLDAVGQARRLTRKGSRLVLTGGTDASLCPYGLTAQLSHGGLSTVDDSERAYLPFSAEASGHLPGEGGAILVLESAESAEERGAGNYGRVLGYASGFDPAPDTGRPRALRRIAAQAVVDAGLTPADIDVVFADASGQPADDRDEAEALAALFGPRGVPVTAPKTMTGRLLGGGAPLDVATALLALRDGVVPPTIGVETPVADYALDLVTAGPRELPLRHALVLARGVGGFTSALVLGR
ncbi:ketosynthase chain-length factor [Streptomyces sp. NPDC056817]|uniref:ketosynthase chain-length factor n=1 Tax=Streptomyces sp. NPDC056817 TaxID=3345950 RepID=UPI0036B55DBD